MHEIAAPNEKRGSKSIVALLAGLAYFVAAFVSLDLTQGSGGIAAIWPASGVLVAALLLTSPAQRVGVLAAIGLASMASNLLFDTPVLTAAAFTLANLVEGLTITSLIAHLRPRDSRFDSLRSIAQFFSATIIGGFVASTIATVLGGAMSPTFFVSWFTTVVLGNLIVTPVLLTIASQLNSEGYRSNMARMAPMLLLIAVLAAVSYSIFNLRLDYAFFIPLMGVIVATYIYGALGAALSISAIALAMVFGVQLSPDNPAILGLDLEILGFQLYLLCLIGAAWPLTAILAEKERLIRRYSDTNAFLKLAESTAHVGHWFIGKDHGAPMWSEEVYRIHGIAADADFQAQLSELGNPQSLQLYHPDDRANVRAILVDAMEDAAPFDYVAKVVRPDGTVRHVHSVGQPHFDENGCFDGLFGTSRDVTEQAETLHELQAARKEALREAAEAKRISETDDLTGIANRRKILAVLNQAGRRAVRHRIPLCVGIVDIDHFKLVNDQFGHATGDEVLKRVAKIIQDALGKGCKVGRLGGEEFLIVLPDVHERAGVTLLELLRARISNEDWGEGGPDCVTVSTGLAQLGPNGDVNAALKTADTALYAVKQGGRNAVRHAGSVKRFNDDLLGTFEAEDRHAG